MKIYCFCKANIAIFVYLVYLKLMVTFSFISVAIIFFSITYNTSIIYVQFWNTNKENWLIFLWFQQQGFYSLDHTCIALNNVSLLLHLPICYNWSSMSCFLLLLWSLRYQFFNYKKNKKSDSVTLAKSLQYQHHDNVINLWYFQWSQCLIPFIWN